MFIDTQNSTISEFSVQFLSPTYSDNFLKKMGGRDYITKFKDDSDKGKTADEAFHDSSGFDASTVADFNEPI